MTRRTRNHDVKTQRVRDPIHGLITFAASSKIEQLVWRLIDCREFQRLRRIKQLGFSDLVYPGATHSRFAHSIGVFHNARRLLTIIKGKLGSRKYDEKKAIAAMCAALLHDVGHGPFSHAFESALKQMAGKKRHEQWSVEIIEGETEINSRLAEYDKKLPSEVASIIRAETPRDFYDAIISSQFDADRLDYLVRDRYMTGVQIGGIDFDWLLDCLEIGDIYVGQKSDGPRKADFVKVPGLVLNKKGFAAAEEYLQARFQLYEHIYLHKTTRAAERMFGAFLRTLVRETKAAKPEKLDIPSSHPLVQFLKSKNDTLGNFSLLNDSSVWSLLQVSSQSRHQQLAELSKRLLDRRLYKCVDIGTLFREPGSDAKLRFVERLRDEARGLGLVSELTLLEDDPRFSGYDWYSWNEDTALKKVLVQGIERNENIDIGDKSEVIKTLKKKEFYRVYVPDEDSRARVEKLGREAAR